MKNIQKSLSAITFACILKLSSILKISFLVGSYAVWFSGASILAPLAGTFGGIMGATLVCIARMALHFLFFKSLSLSFLALCIPGFCASLYWTTSSSIVRLYLPLACMGLFIAHPVGNQAFVYSLYWLIPVALYFIPKKSLYLQALGSTFVAHAVGSVIWLYTVPMTSAMWLGLIPLVACERFVFALGMVCTYKIALWSKNTISHYTTPAPQLASINQH
jgi:hypothetical protein